MGSSTGFKNEAMALVSDRKSLIVGGLKVV